MKNLTYLLILILLSACDVGLESNLQDYNAENFVNKSRQAHEKEIEQILGTYRGELYTIDNKLLSKNFVVHFFKDTERVVVEGKSNFFVKPRAMIYFENIDSRLVPSSIRIVNVYFSAHSGEISLSSEAKGSAQNPNFGFFNAIGQFAANKIHLSAVIDHNGQLKPFTLVKD